MGKLTKAFRKRLEGLGTTNLSDAMDALGFVGSTYGINPMWEGCRKIIGEAVTIKAGAPGFTKASGHMGVTAIEAAKPGDVIVLDNGGRTDVNTFGGIIATACKVKGLSGWVSDGAVRDLEEIIDIDFPVYARGRVVATNRGRLMEYGTNVMVTIGGLQVRPGDVIVGDKSGIVVIPQEKLEEVIIKAEEVQQKEDNMISQLNAGIAISKVDSQSNYENMLKKD
jgi:regulator of RNase E activity RraA